MPIDLPGVSKQFEDERSNILDWENHRDQSVMRLQSVIEDIVPLDPQLTAEAEPGNGALIVEPGALVHSFGIGWDTRKEAMVWADGVLSGRRVAAVDGSQIYPRKGDGVPMAMVNAALVANPHEPDGELSISRKQKLLTPPEFKDRHIYRYSDSYVDARRFQMECELASEEMAKGGGLIMMDGSFVLTHIASLRAELKEVHLGAVKGLLSESISKKVPTLAYIDRSTSHDIITMLQNAGGLGKTDAVTDAYLLKATMAWGDRSAVFLCDRKDGDGPGIRSEEDWTKVAFFYIQLSGGEPSRVEFPLWIYEDGLVDEIAATLRALAVVRGGYPDTLKRAHDEAVIHRSEGTLFYNMVDHFFKKEGVANDLSRKDMFKRM